MTRPQRLPGLPADEWDDETAEILGGLVQTGRQRPVHLPAVIANHPSLLGPYIGWAKAVALNGVLSPRLNSMLALRTAHNGGSEFEWGVHAESAVVRSGLTPDDVAAVAAGPGDATWTEAESLLLRAADELHQDKTITDETWAALRAHFDEVDLLEATFIVGHYTMLSMVVNAMGVPPEPTWPGLGGAPS